VTAFPVSSWIGNPSKDEFLLSVSAPNANVQVTRRAAWNVIKVDRFSSQLDSVQTPTMKVITNEGARRVFADRILNIVDGYTDAQKFLPNGQHYNDKMTGIWHELLSVVKLNCRALQGSAHTSLRDTFQYGQLRLDPGYAFDQTVFVQNTRKQPSAPSDTATSSDGAAVAASRADIKAAADCEALRKKLDDDNTAIRKARFQSSQGFFSRAANLLSSYTSASSQQQDPDTVYSNLAKLHPGGEAPGRFSDRVRENFDKIARPTLAEIQAATKRGMKGASPGPTAWTEELLFHVLCANDPRTNEFIAMFHDMLRNRVDPSVALRLSNATLIGLPKPDGGTRPIAMGEVFIKCATRIAIERDDKRLKETFKNLQFGVAVKGGGERIIHTVRNWTRTMTSKTSRCVLCIDFSNAFNAPLRTEMAKQAQHFPNLAPIFELEYANHSKLFVRGTGRDIPSERGARQGTTSGPVFFCLAIQHMLNRLNNMQDVSVMAYMDDITLMCETHAAADAALKVVQEESEKLHIAVNLKKCELYVAEEHRSSHALASQFKVPVGNACLKLLGAAIGTTAAEEIKKVDALCGPARYDTFFRRLRTGMIGPAGTTILGKCGVAKFSFAVRTHEPSVVLDAAKSFDAAVIQCIQTWAVCDVDDVVRVLAGLPVRMGGLGFTPQVEILPGAYAASRNTALEIRADGVAFSQQALSAIVFDKMAAVVDESPLVKRHREHSAIKESSSLFFAVDTHVAPSDFSAALRWRLFAPVLGISAHPECPGCATRFDSPREFMCHAPNCTHVPGTNASSRHAVLKTAVKKVMADNEVNFGSTEPRHCHVVTCPGCHIKMKVDDFAEHSSGCSQLKLNPAAAAPTKVGPDIAVFLPIGAAYSGQLVDVTVCGAECPTHRDKPLEGVYAACERRKCAAYEAFVPDDQKLVVFGCTENGVMSPQANSFISRVVTAGRGNLNAAKRLIATRVLAAHGASLANAERKLGIKVVVSTFKPAAVIRRALTFQEAEPTPLPAVAAASAAIAPVTVALANQTLAPLPTPVASTPAQTLAAPLLPPSNTSDDAAVIVGVLAQAAMPQSSTGPVRAATDGAISSTTAVIPAPMPQPAPFQPPAPTLPSTMADAAAQHQHPPAPVPQPGTAASATDGAVSAPATPAVAVPAPQPAPAQVPRRVQSECPPAWSANGFERNGPAQQLQLPAAAAAAAFASTTASSDSASPSNLQEHRRTQTVLRPKEFSYNGDLELALSPGRTTLMQSQEAVHHLQRLRSSTAADGAPQQADPTQHVASSTPVAVENTNGPSDSSSNSSPPPVRRNVARIVPRYRDYAADMSPNRTTFLSNSYAPTFLANLLSNNDAAELLFTDNSAETKVVRYAFTNFARLADSESWRNLCATPADLHHFLERIDSQRARENKRPLFDDATRGLVFAAFTFFGVISQVWNNGWSSANVVNGFDNNAQPPRAAINFDVATSIAQQFQAAPPAASAGPSAPISASNNNNNNLQDGSNNTCQQH